MILIGSFTILAILIGVKLFFYSGMSWVDFFTLKPLRTSNNSSTGSLDKTLEDTSKGDTPTVSGAQCEIEGEDIFNGYVFSKTGSHIKIATKIDCDNCNKYVNKINSKCINYIYDKSENESSGDKSDWPGNKKTSDANPNEGVCTGSIKPTGAKCPF